MSMIKDCTTTKPPSTAVRSSCFLGCFGCSGENKKIIQPRDKVNLPSRRRWISKWDLISFRKSATKTVPAELTTVSRKLKSFHLSEKNAPATSDTTWEIQLVEEDATLTKKSVIMHAPVTSDEQKIRPKKRTGGILKRQNGSTRNNSQKEITKAAATTTTVAGRLDPPLKKSATISNYPVVSSPLTQSTSQPPPKGKKPSQAPPAGGGADNGAFDKPPMSARRVDSVIGMSVILVTLVIMLLWGKLCAILCTSAWFFIAPRLVAGAGGERSALSTVEKGRRDSQNNLDLESTEYKKKVVLEGLLQRNHRNVIVGGM